MRFENFFWRWFWSSDWSIKSFFFFNVHARNSDYLFVLTNSWITSFFFFRRNVWSFRWSNNELIVDRCKIFFRNKYHFRIFFLCDSFFRNLFRSFFRWYCDQIFFFRKWCDDDELLFYWWNHDFAFNELFVLDRFTTNYFFLVNFLFCKIEYIQMYFI